MKHVKRPGVQLRKHAFIFIVATACLMTKASGQQKLKAFEGYYQSKDNKDVFLEITAKEDSLILKQLWDGGQVSFHQTAPLDFYCDAASFPLKFTDSAGSIIRVLAFDKDVWNKVNEYTPPVHKEIQLTPTELSACEGKYKLEGGDADAVLQISYKGNNLILKQLWDGQEISFKPESQVDFYNEEKSFPLKFSKNGQGAVTQVIAFGRDVWIKVK
jgi:hypothetical protein